MQFRFREKSPSESTQTQQPTLGIMHGRAPKRRLKISERFNALEIAPHLGRNHRPNRLIIAVLILRMKLAAPVENDGRLIEGAHALVDIPAPFIASVVKINLTCSNTGELASSSAKLGVMRHDIAIRFSQNNDPFGGKWADWRRCFSLVRSSHASLQLLKKSLNIWVVIHVTKWPDAPSSATALGKAIANLPTDHLRSDLRVTAHR
jgi:hypothetical protein